MKAPPDVVDDPETTAGAGLMFWQNYFVIVYANGNYAVWRQTPDWVAVLASTKFEKLKAGPNAVNEIKVTTLNNVVTLFFNGEKATELRAQAPKNGGEFGVYAQSSKDKSNEWRFLSIVVNE